MARCEGLPRRRYTGQHLALDFASYGEDAARLMVTERQVAALRADVASIDFGASTDFIVHRVAVVDRTIVVGKHGIRLEKVSRVGEPPVAWR